MTSRAALHLAAEHQFAVPPLASPTSTAPDIVEQVIRDVGSRALFIERAQAVKPDFRLTTRTLRPLPPSAARLDGLPLAIELAAARSKVLPPQALLARLEQAGSTS